MAVVVRAIVPVSGVVQPRLVRTVIVVSGVIQPGLVRAVIPGSGTSPASVMGGSWSAEWIVGADVWVNSGGVRYSDSGNSSMMSVGGVSVGGIGCDSVDSCEWGHFIFGLLLFRAWWSKAIYYLFIIIINYSLMLITFPRERD